jgi:hypothetical protein
MRERGIELDKAQARHREHAQQHEIAKKRISRARPPPPSPARVTSTIATSAAASSGGGLVSQDGSAPSMWPESIMGGRDATANLAAS